MTVTPEGDQVMSGGDPEVGQLLGIGYIIHIHKQHPVVAERTVSAQPVYSVTTARLTHFASVQMLNSHYALS